MAIRSPTTGSCRLSAGCTCIRIGRASATCAERRKAHASTPNLAELRALLAASLATARGPSVARNALADWYEERGFEVEARWVREEWDIAKAKRLLKAR